MTLLKQSNGMELLNMRIPIRITSKKNGKNWNPKIRRYFNTQATKVLTNTIAWAAKSHRVLTEPTTAPVAMELICHFKDRRHSDTPNCQEIVCDALEDIIYYNDRQIGPLLVRPCECGEDALTVRVRTTDQQEGTCVDA